ncbi:MAG: sigma-54 dependent transcriptional regulator [Bdellovibrionota bacterium]
MRALIVDDEEILRMTVRSALESRKYSVEEAEDGIAAVELVSKLKADGEIFDVVVLDVNMPKMSGIEALEKIKEISPQTFCLVATAYTDVKDAVLAMKYGAYDYIEKPLDKNRLLQLLDSAEEANELVKAVAFSAPQVKFDEGRQIIGGSSEIQKVFDVIHKLSKVETSVMIRGESGTGKELVARAVHFNSHRKKGPFIAVNCAALPENLIESELFGHERGAFTGADKKKIGKFQFAEGGTIFLDEIGDISLSMQVKLLRVLQEKTFTPVGNNQEIKADVRIVAATNRPLEQMIQKGTYRSDLFYRLNVLPIQLPPLRDRREDISALVDFMINKFNRTHKREIKSIDKKALNALRLYSWPGNIRELENVIEHAFILEANDIINIESLPEHISNSGSNKTDASNTEMAKVSPMTKEVNIISDFSELNYPALKERFEKEFLIRALKAFNGRVNQTAEHTKMTKVTLLRKLERYGIDPKQYHRH